MLPEAVTWAQIAPALPPANLTARSRAIDLAEGPIWELLRDPTKVLVPSAEWPEAVPQANVWVASDSGWADICKGCARRSSGPEMFSHVSGRQFSMACSRCQRGQVGGGYQPSNFEADLERDSFQYVPTDY